MPNSDWENISFHSSSMFSGNWEEITCGTNNFEIIEETEQELKENLVPSKYSQASDRFKFIEESEILGQDKLLEWGTRRRRGRLFDKELETFNNFRGKSRRRKCCCHYCRESLQIDVQQTRSTEDSICYSLQHQENHLHVYAMTDFDLKSKNLGQYFVGMRKSRLEARGVYVFDLPVLYGVITPQVEYKRKLCQENSISSLFTKSSPKLNRNKKLFVPDCYYEFRDSSFNNNSFNLKHTDVEEIMSLVRKKTNIGMIKSKLDSASIFEENKEDFIKFEPKFISKLTKLPGNADLQ